MAFWRDEDGQHTLFTANIVCNGAQRLLTRGGMIRAPSWSPDGQRVQYFFVLTALDTAGNQSGYSNEVNTWIDFEGPGIPTRFTVTVTVVPQ